MSRVTIISHCARTLVNFRGELIRTLVSLGHEVTAVGPEAGYEADLEALGAKYRQVPLDRTGTNPLSDIRTLALLVGCLLSVRAQVVLSYAIKPVIYGSMAAWLAGVRRRYSMITGLGYVFTDGSAKRRALSRVVCPLYRSALGLNQAVFFQNPDDLRLFRSLRLLPPDKRSVIINGSGVDIDRFAFRPSPVGEISFILVARLIWDKGIGEYVKASKNLKRRYPCVSFRLLGPFDSNPTAISQEDILRWQDDGIEYLGETSDVRPYLANSSVYVLPSYREGTPRSVLEAMSMGMPVVTTEAPGCRETVEEGQNGFLVPIKNVDALEKAMEQFIINPQLIQLFGSRSRKMAEEKYDVRKVNQVILKVMGLDEDR